MIDVLAVLLNRIRARDRGIAAPGPAVSHDAAFLSGLNSVAAVEFDRNAAAGPVGEHGGPPPDWQPLAGFEAVPCRIVWKRVAAVPGDARPGMVRFGRVLFGLAVPADRRHRLTYADAAFGERHAYLTGPVVDAHMMGHHWFADIQDRPL